MHPGRVLVFFLVLVCRPAFPEPAAIDGALRTLWDIEIGRLRARGDEDLKTFQLRKVAGLLSDPALQTTLRALGVDPAKPISLASLQKLNFENTEQLSRLLSLLRVENSKRDEPLLTDDATILRALGRQEIARFREAPETPIALPAEIQKGLRDAYAALHPEIEFKAEELSVLTAGQIEEVLKRSADFKPSLAQAMALAGELRLAALSHLGNGFFEGTHPDHSDGTLADVPKNSQSDFRRRYIDPPPTQPQEREDRHAENRAQPDGSPIPTDRGHGNSRYGREGVEEILRRISNLPKLAPEELSKLKHADRGSEKMEIGTQYRSPGGDGEAYFAPKALCQATPIARTPLTEENRDQTCRFVLGSARHCFGSFDRDRDALNLAGFGVVPPSRREVLVSSKASEKDFAAILVDAPCSTVVDIKTPAPQGQALKEGSGVSIDVHRMQTGVLSAQTFKSADSGFFGVAVLNGAGIFPGDSGGGVCDEDGHYVGAISSKFTNSDFRNRAGRIAKTPPWLYEGLAGEFLDRPLSDYKTAFGRHQRSGAAGGLATHSPGTSRGALEIQ